MVGLTGEAILTDIQTTPEIEPPIDHRDERQVVTATFHHSSGDVIDLVMGNPNDQSSMTNEAAESGEPKAESGGHESEISDFKSPLGDLPKTENHTPKTVGFAISDSPLLAFGSPLSVDSDSERIGTTANHPFWSIDRQEYVQAGRLEIGERLQTLSGDVKVVQ